MKKGKGLIEVFRCGKQERLSGSFEVHYPSHHNNLKLNNILTSSQNERYLYLHEFNDNIHHKEVNQSLGHFTYHRQTRKTWRDFRAKEIIIRIITIISKHCLTSLKTQSPLTTLCSKDCLTSTTSLKNTISTNNIVFKRLSDINNILKTQSS